jgi:hypothetical protein
MPEELQADVKKVFVQSFKEFRIKFFVESQSIHIFPQITILFYLYQE